MERNGTLDFMSEHNILVQPSKENLVEFHFIKKTYNKMNK